MKNYCVECAMNDEDRKKNRLRVYKCEKCGHWTDEDENSADTVIEA